MFDEAEKQGYRRSVTAEQSLTDQNRSCVLHQEGVREVGVSSAKAVENNDTVVGGVEKVGGILYPSYHRKCATRSLLIDFYL